MIPMGLKYNYFLYKGAVTDLKSKLLSAKRFSPKDNREILDAYYDMSKQFDWSLVKKDVNRILELAKPQVLLDYEKRQQYVSFFSVWGKQLFDTGYVFGGFTNTRLFPRLYDVVLGNVFEESGIFEYGLVNYHHNENTGFFRKIDLVKQSALNVSMTDLEKQNHDYESFASRIESAYQYPLSALHSFLDPPCGWAEFEWDFEVEFVLPKPKTEDN